MCVLVFVCTYQTLTPKCRVWMCRRIGFAFTKPPVPIPMLCMYQEGALGMCSLPMDFGSRSRIIGWEFLAFIAV